MSNNKMKIAIIAVIIAVLVALTAGVIYYVRNKMTVYDKDGMVYDGEPVCAGEADEQKTENKKDGVSISRFSCH